MTRYRLVPVEANDAMRGAAVMAMFKSDLATALDPNAAFFAAWSAALTASPPAEPDQALVEEWARVIDPNAFDEHVPDTVIGGLSLMATRRQTARNVGRTLIAKVSGSEKTDG